MFIIESYFIQSSLIRYFGGKMLKKKTNKLRFFQIELI